MSQRAKPSLLRRKGNGVSFSGSAFVELARAVLDKGVPFRFKARGISMYPFIRHGDIITISPLSGSLPRYGEVVAFVRPTLCNLIVHRVIGRRDSDLIIKGDNIARPDGFIPTSNILGRVTKVERSGREIYLGLGPERLLIAFLTRWELLSPLLAQFLKLIRPILKKRAI